MLYSTIQLDKASFYGPINTEDDELSTTSTLKTMKTIGNDKVIDPYNRDPLTGSLNMSEKRKIATLLDRWEEPDRHNTGLVSCLYVFASHKLSHPLTRLFRMNKFRSRQFYDSGMLLILLRMTIRSPTHLDRHIHENHALSPLRKSTAGFVR